MLALFPDDPATHPSGQNGTFLDKFKIKRVMTIFVRQGDEKYQFHKILKGTG